jgi:hypothetical protein
MTLSFIEGLEEIDQTQEKDVLKESGLRGIWFFVCNMPACYARGKCSVILV